MTASRLVTATAVVAYRSSLHGVGEAGRVPVELWYDPADPHAVRLQIEDDGNVWVFARDLLRDGLAAHAGLMDVRVWTCGPTVHIALSDRDDGRVILDLPALMVARFVGQCWRLVPDGAERFDCDGFLTRVLDGGGRG